MKLRNIIFAVFGLGLVSQQALADGPNVSTLVPAQHDMQWYLNNGYNLRTESTTPAGSGNGGVTFILSNGISTPSHPVGDIVICSVELNSPYMTTCFAITKED